MKQSTQIPAIDYNALALAMAALQQPASVQPANSLALSVSQAVTSPDLVTKAREDAISALSLLDQVNASSEDTNQVIGRFISVCASNGTLPAFGDSFNSGLNDAKYTHLTTSYRGQLRSYMNKIVSFGPAVIEHLIIPAGRVGSGKYYSLQKLYKKLQSIGKPLADELPEWLRVNMQVCEELRGLLQIMAKDTAFNKPPLLTIKTGLDQSYITLFTLVEEKRPLTEDEKAAKAKAKEAEKAAKAKEAEKAKTKK